MKKAESHKQVKVATIHLNPLKVLIEQSYSTKAYHQVKAVLQSGEPKPKLLTTLHNTRKEVVSSAMAKRPDTKYKSKPGAATAGATGKHHTEISHVQDSGGSGGKGKLKHKTSTESTNELTDTLPTGPCQSIGFFPKPLNPAEQHKQNVIRWNLLRSYRDAKTESDIEDVNKIIYNDRAHIVAIFKDYLIYDDIKDILPSYIPVRESITLLPRIIRAVKPKFVPCDAILAEQKILKKGKERKEKVRRIKEEDKLVEEDGSTFFRTAFMNSLAKEDLSNSLSRLPANSLECSNDEDSKRILELMKEINSNDVSLHVKKAHIELRSAPKEEVKKRPSQQTKTNAKKKPANELNKRIGAAPKSKPSGKQISAARAVPPRNVISSQGCPGKYRPPTAMQTKGPMLSPYFVSPRTVRVAPDSKLDSAAKHDSSIGASSIDGLSKGTFRNFRLQHKDSHGLENKESTLLSILGDSKSQASKDLGSVSQSSQKSPHAIFQFRSLETDRRRPGLEAQPPRKNTATASSNYFAGYNKQVKAKSKEKPGSRQLKVREGERYIKACKVEVKSQCSKRSEQEKCQDYYRTNRKDPKPSSKALKSIKEEPKKLRSPIAESTATLLLKSSQIARLVKQKHAGVQSPVGNRPPTVLGKKGGETQRQRLSPDPSVTYNKARPVKKCFSPNELAWRGMKTLDDRRLGKK